MTERAGTDDLELVDAPKHKWAVSGSPNGPWLGLSDAEHPQQVLDKARASFDWPVIWVAKMRPLDGSDIVPSPQVLWGDVEEWVVEHFGSSVAEELAGEFDLTDVHTLMEDAVTDYLVQKRIPVWVPSIKQPYSQHQNVRGDHFRKVKPSLTAFGY